MSHLASRSAAVALTSAALVGLSALAIPGAAGADDINCGPEDVTYAVTGGTIEWGVKQSFRNYIKGPIAHGTWVLGEGVTFAGAEKGPDGHFEWPLTAATSEVASESSATATSAGSVTFSGHDDVLATTLSNPTVEINGTEGSLKLDFRAKEAESFTPNSPYVWIEGTQETAVEFSLDAAPDFHGSTTIAITSGATELEEGFAAAMGSVYTAGDPMDPVTLNLNIGATCADESGDGGDPGTDPGDGQIPGTDDEDDNGGFLGSLRKLFSFGF